MPQAAVRGRTRGLREERRDRAAAAGVVGPKRPDRHGPGHLAVALGTRPVAESDGAAHGNGAYLYQQTGNQPLHADDDTDSPPGGHAGSFGVLPDHAGHDSQSSQQQRLDSVIGGGAGDCGEVVAQSTAPPLVTDSDLGRAGWGNQPAQPLPLRAVLLPA